MPQTTEPALIEVKVNAIHQLFNSIDPSPFHERDLDHDAEQFIVSWAQEHPARAPLKLVVHLARPAEELDEAQSIITESVRHYFQYRGNMIRRDRCLLLKEGRVALMIGFVFLSVCELVAQGLTPTADTWHAMLREGLTIIGWVAMWKPLDIFLYRWWPLLQLERVYRNLSAMAVEVRMGK
jgi:hypothetical protein